MPNPKILKGWAEPTPLDLEAFHERVVTWATKTFNDKPMSEIMIGFFIFAGHGQATIVHAPWEGEAEKYAMAASIRRMLHHPMGKEVVEAYAFITEAWAVVLKPDEVHGELPRPSQHPDREDVFNIWSTQRDGKTKMTRFGVRSYPNPLPWLPPKKKPRLLERDDHFGDGGEMVGAMFNFFDTEEEMNKRTRKAEAKHKREQKRKQKEQDNDNG